MPHHSCIPWEQFPCPPVHRGISFSSSRKYEQLAVKLFITSPAHTPHHRRRSCLSGRSHGFLGRSRRRRAPWRPGTCRFRRAARRTSTARRPSCGHCRRTTRPRGAKRCSCSKDALSWRGARARRSLCCGRSVSGSLSCRHLSAVRARRSSPRLAVRVALGRAGADAPTLCAFPPCFIGFHFRSDVGGE